MKKFEIGKVFVFFLLGLYSIFLVVIFLSLFLIFRPKEIHEYDMVGFYNIRSCSCLGAKVLKSSEIRFPSEDSGLPTGSEFEFRNYQCFGIIEECKEEAGE